MLQYDAQVPVLKITSEYPAGKGNKNWHEKYKIKLNAIF